MFNNPLNRKYQTGGPAPTDDERKDMEGFITWIKSNVEGFKDKSTKEIAQSISDMAKSEEGKKSVQNLYSKYQKSKKQKSRFADGGKMQSFICKHAHGGNVDCGCGGMVVRAEPGTQLPERRVRRAARRNATRVPDAGSATRRKVGYTDIDGNHTVYEDAVVNGTSAETYATATPQGDTIVVQKFPVAGGNDTAVREYPMGSIGYRVVMPRLRPHFKVFDVPEKQEGGTLVEQEPNKPIIERVTGQQGMDYYNQHSEDRLPQKPHDRHIYTLDLPGHAYNPDYANPGQYEINIAPYTSYSNLYKDLRDQYGEDWLSIGQAVKRRMHKCGGKVVKEQGGEEIPDTGTISQGKSRSKLGKAIDDNPKARHFVEGAKRFVKSPVFKLPAAGLAAYGGWKLGDAVSLIAGESEIPKLANATFAYLSQFKPKAMLKEVDTTKNASDIFWVINRNSALDKFLSGDKNKNNE